MFRVPNSPFIPRSRSLLSVALLACLVANGTAQQRTRRIQPIHDLQGRLIGTTANLQSAFGGTFAQAAALPIVTVQFSPGPIRVHVTIPNTGTNWAEEFLAFIPSGPIPPASSPLLMLFHGAGQQPTNALPALSVESLASPMITDAINRGWHILIPLGGHAFNYGHPDAQINTQLSMEVFMSMFGTAINPSRVYGYGHSMGAGWMLAQAAMRSGVDDLGFAALFSNAGTPSNAFSYNAAFDAGILDIIFGTDPDSDPFIYSRSSMADVAEQFPFPVNPSSATCVNLIGTPIRSWTCWWDRLQYKIAAHSVHDFLDSLPSPNHLSIPTCSSPYHYWRNPDNVAVLDWMGNQVRSDPDPEEFQTVLADRDAQFQYFDLRQTVSGEFSRLNYQLFPSIPNDKLIFLNPENIEQIGFSVARMGIVTSPNFEILVSPEGAPVPDVFISDVSTPLAVERFDGSAWVAATYSDLATGGILLDGASNPAPAGDITASWRITP